MRNWRDGCKRQDELGWVLGTIFDPGSSVRRSGEARCTITAEMTIGTKPAADVEVAPSLVRALLQAQQPDLAHLVPVKVYEGWDNALFRLGDELVVRLPRRAASAMLIEHEQRWLPHLSPRLPVPVPVPLRVGVPSRMFGWALVHRPMAS